jgi:hypothetical protein
MTAHAGMEQDPELPMENKKNNTISTRIFMRKNLFLTAMAVLCVCCPLRPAW